MNLEAEIRSLASRLESAVRLTVLTGAGVSAGSGIPTFRGADGLWKSFRAEELATPEAFARDPRTVWEWYDWRRQRIAGASPNRAHEVLAAWSRRIPGFDYSDGGSVRATYQVIGPRETRPDGKKPFIPDYVDNKTPRPNRYIMIDFVEPVAGVSDADFEVALARHVAEVLGLPGWMAAQRFHVATPPPGTAPPHMAFTKYLVIWETEGGSAQGLQDALTAATRAGQVKTLATDAATAQSSWWVPTSPFITKDDFQR